MKMTRLEWRYLQRIALDHPYYDTHKPPLSDAEARAIMEANNMMTGREFVDSIYAKLGMTRPVKEKRRLAWLSNIGELFAVPPIRKIAIAILVVLLMTVFFAATPTGRAIAESVIQYIVTLFEDGELVMNQPDNKSALVLVDDEDHLYGYEQQDGQSDYITVKTFDDFTKDTGRIPATLPLSCTELYYVYDPDISYLELYSTYDTTEGKIVAYQIWDMECITSSTLDGFSLYDLDDSVYYSIEEKTGYIYCKVFYEDSVFSITSKGNYTLDDLIRMLKER